ncbi:hypothetical protein H1D32_02190 [Anaerobacillus sp. CMMVII]|uniref:hypothetical protein n=1 Tax=Anaerobacillus sp. CMMVII TaxID=2755588 RepID=UPI0021B83BE2|nr:hypothetical protein [Anaerobacillus sp. CMMVII]MCT8136661.1 hypothetical protein [Anaerobacillus sp. CMMVII]
MRLKLLFFVLLFLLVGCSVEEETIIDSEDKVTESVLKSPPKLFVTSGENSIRARHGVYSWSYALKDGTHTGIEASADAPPGIVQKVPLNVDRNDELSLDFEIEPYRYLIRTWDEDNTITGEFKSIDLTEHEGTVIFEVLAYFEQGTVSYAFLVNVE